MVYGRIQPGDENRTMVYGRIQPGDENRTMVYGPIQPGDENRTIDKEVPLYNRQTDWDSFRDIVDDSLKLKVALKSSGDVDNATMQFTNTIQTACWRCTPQKSEYGMRLKNVPWEIRKRIQEKRRLRRVWHTSRCPSDKTALNKAMFELKTMIKDTDDETMQNHLESLTATKATNYSLWKVMKNNDNKPQRVAPRSTQAPYAHWNR
ncbi:Uncharacterized protein OBRU01_05181 [Operophtera brumata]|uniref:Uncharacterized protein n=1 Tax=Operophtera brumata TaxID=104452 RepID=A0A0L7LNI4_OPEBR|nr:Uncharacterized protein OBRU01_05181 [Operophtera brumata]